MLRGVNLQPGPGHPLIDIRKKRRSAWKFLEMHGCYRKNSYRDTLSLP